MRRPSTLASSNSRSGGDTISTAARRTDSVRLCSLLRQLNRAAMLVAASTFVAVPRAMVWAAAPQGVWLMRARAAVQICDCGGPTVWPDSLAADSSKS